MLWVMIVLGALAGAVMDGWTWDGAALGAFIGAGACLFVAALVWLGNSGGAER